MFNAAIMSDVTRPHSVQKQLHWVRITKNHHDVVYLRIDLPSPVLIKWMWFFKYRAALIQVANPRADIKLEHGSSLVEIRQQEMIDHINSQIKRLNAKICKNKELIQRTIEEWDELLPIEESPAYEKAMLYMANDADRLDKLNKAIEQVKKEGWTMKLWNEHYK